MFKGGFPHMGGCWGQGRLDEGSDKGEIGGWVIYYPRVRIEMSKREVFEYEGMPALVDRRMSPKKMVTKLKPRSRKVCDKGISRLTKKQRAALTVYMENGMTNKTAAVEAAGYAHPEVMGSRVINPLMGRKPIVKALEKYRVTDDKIALAIADGMDAMSVVKPEMADHHVRLKAVAEANKILDNYPAKRIEMDSRVVNINLSGDDFKALKKYQEMRAPDGQS